MLKTLLKVNHSKSVLEILGLLFPHPVPSHQSLLYEKTSEGPYNF